MLSKHTRSRVTILFQWQDWNRNGTIDEGDYRVSLAKHAKFLGIKRGSIAYERLLSALQNDWFQLCQHAGKSDREDISLEDFLAYHDTMFTTHQNATTVIAQKILEGIDSDNDGRISKQEWFNYLGMMEIDNSRIEEIFAKINLTGDGYLTFAEMLSALDAWYLNEDPNHPGHWLFGDPNELEQALDIRK